MLPIESSDFEQADTLPAAAGHTSTTTRVDALADPCGGLRWHAETPGLYRMRLLPVIFTHTGSRARAAGHRGVCVCLWAAGRCRIDVDGQRDRAPGPARAAYFPVQQMPAAALAVRNSSKLLLALARKFFLCLSHKIRCFAPCLFSSFGQHFLALQPNTVTADVGIGESETDYFGKHRQCVKVR